MKKIVFILILSLAFSCQSSRVCGGKGGARCVDISKT
jgi:hypothetical protein